MKKLLALILSVLMLVSFAACDSSSTTNDDVRGDITSTSSDTDSSSSDSTSSEEIEFSIGDAEGNKYENKFIGIGCELDSSWTFYTDAQIAELNNIVTDSLDEDYAEQVKDANVIYDMYATTANGDTININLEKLSGIGSGVIDAETYIDVAMPQLKDSMAQMGVTVDKCEKTTFNFAGATADGIIMNISGSGASAFQKIVCLKRGSYIAVIGVATYNTDTTDDLLAKFYSLNDVI